jgi:hypothetical protein
VPPITTRNTGLSLSRWRGMSRSVMGWEESRRSSTWLVRKPATYTKMVCHSEDQSNHPSGHKGASHHRHNPSGDSNQVTRTFVCVQEIDHVLDRPMLGQGQWHGAVVVVGRRRVALHEIRKFIRCAGE